MFDRKLQNVQEVLPNFVYSDNTLKLGQEFLDTHYNCYIKGTGVSLD